MTNVSNLKTLKSNADKATAELHREIERINSELPDGVQLVMEGLGSQETERLVTLNNTDEIQVGDTVRLIEDRAYLTVGNDYVVTHRDSAGDPQTIDDDGDCHDMGGSAHRYFQKVVKVSQAPSGQPVWTVLTGENRSMLKVGDCVKVTGGESDIGIEFNKEYRIESKPDNDGRFHDDQGNRRDTMEWLISSRAGHMVFRSV